MASVLIIRSVSLQQLDNTIKQVQSVFPGSSIDLLTHEHALEQCRKYAGLRRVIPYEHSKDFSPLRPAGNLPEKHYDAVIVPFSNISGAGFLNVLLFALRLRPKRIYSGNLAGTVTPLSKMRIALRLLASLICWPLALGVFLILAPPSILWLSVSALYGRLRKRKT